MTDAYRKLEEHFRLIGDFEHAVGILRWDHAVMMPPGSAAARASALASLSGHLHQLYTDPRIPEWADAAGGGELDGWQAANLREIRHCYTVNTALPEDLVAALARTTSQSEHAWRELREQNNWAGFRPHLEEVVTLTRQRGQALGEALGQPPYDALVGVYQQGIERSDIDRLFAELAGFLPGLIEGAMARQAERDPLPEPPRGIGVEGQRALALAVTKSLGFDFSRGRLDTAHHPFSGGATGDTRITTRFFEDRFLHSLLAVIHETGHALYEQNRPAGYSGQPVGEARGLVVHESQSLFMEQQLAKSAAWIGYLAPVIRRHLAPGDTADERWSAGYLQRLLARVKPGLIRVDADECTYPMHVILRYELEKRLVGGEMAVADIPDAWDEGMGRLLGLRTGGDYRNGCMQDVHWAAGAIGYFPTYSLGALMAAQLMAALREVVDDLPGQLAQGDLSGIMAWLEEHVWSQGSRFELAELLQRATGKPLGTEDFRAHLETRYLS